MRAWGCSSRALSHLRAHGALLLALCACRLETEGTGERWTTGDDAVNPDDGDASRADGDEPRSDDGRSDTGREPSDRDRDAARDARIDEDASGARSRDCTQAGAFAMRVDLDVTWLGTAWAGIVPVVAEGAGTLTVHALATFADDALSRGTVRACGARIPDFEAGANIFQGELYGTYIPERAWDQATMPTWPIALNTACDEPGCGFSATPLEALLGVRRTQPGPQRPGAGWGRPGSMTTFMPMDDDGDGYPGITLRTRNAPEVDGRGRAYTQPPLGTLLSRADKLMLAIALRLQVQGEFESCDRLTGSLREGSVDTSALGCTSVGGGGGELACDPGAVQFLDQNLPAWTVKSARFQAVRTQASDCASVRAALGP